MAGGDCADDEIRKWALNPNRPTLIIIGGSFFVVARFNGEIWKGAQSVAHGFEFRTFAYPRKDFLANGPDHLYEPLVH